LFGASCIVSRDLFILIKRKLIDFFHSVLLPEQSKKWESKERIFGKNEASSAAGQ
jgi:hypothetical protein